MKIFIIFAMLAHSATCRLTSREKQFNKLQCDKLKQSLESKMDNPIYKLNAQFNKICGEFYQTPKPIDNDPRPIVSFESFVRWMKTRYETNNEIKKRNINA